MNSVGLQRMIQQLRDELNALVTGRALAARYVHRMRVEGKQLIPATTALVLPQIEVPAGSSLEIASGGVLLIV